MSGESATEVAARQLGERVARLEAIMPVFVKMTERLEEKLDRVLETLEKDLKSKASQEQVNGLSAKVDDVQKKIFYASGGAGMLSLVIGWFAKGMFK